MIWLSSVWHDLGEAVSLVGHPLYALEASLSSSENIRGFLSLSHEKSKVLWCCLALGTVVLPPKDWQSKAEETFSRVQLMDRMSPQDGLGWAGFWKGPCLFWAAFRKLRFWKSTVAVHDCSQLWEEE